ncbi:hypothetical protein FDP41_001942 [Naegleria fowleri]|uniref:EGF-like domain-containing protein n=1 Tax=Naegleria fowleri TaxID=5763 RepID=A0A6A5BW63_NAEFO|nr:uncharacterized protein FDP41_001942 [Naegleria fowleri]KAF0978872.1 hypothetical protein FDP41_001942 [Naegleria fowleri]
MYFVDNNLNKVRVYNIQTQNITTVAPGISYSASGWAAPIGNEVYFGNQDAYIKKIGADGAVYDVAGSYGTNTENAKATETPLRSVKGIAWSSQRNEFITFEGYRIRRMYSVCASGWIGPDCGIPLCWNKTSVQGFGDYGRACFGRGNCTSPNTCSCNQGFLGQECESFSCFGIHYLDPFVCRGHGSCVDVNNCTCLPNYTIFVPPPPPPSNNTSIQCFGLNATDSLVCNGHGSCSSTDNCTCYSNYSGANCSILVTDCINCGNSSNNDTNTNNNTGLIQCFGLIASDARVCNGHGNCSGTNNCTCDSHYSGVNCSVTTCFGVFSNSSNVCSGSGTCAALNLCNCRSNYYGDNCEHNSIHYGNNSTQILPPKTETSLTFLWFILPLGLLIIGVVMVCFVVVFVIKLKSRRATKKTPVAIKEQELTSVNIMSA